MEEIKIVNDIDQVANWYTRNQPLLFDYLINFAIAIAIVVIGIVIARIAARTLIRVMKVRHIDSTVTQFLSSLTRYGIIVFTVLVALGHIGVQTTSIIAVIGAAGLAVGLALQGSLSNLAAGVLLIIFRPFRVGEYVDLGGVAGTVRSIQIFSSALYTSDGQMVIVPNSKIITNNIQNFTREPNRRIQIIVGVDYNADIDHVKQVLGDIVNVDPRVITKLGITIRLNEMADSSLKFVVRVWTTNADFWPTYHDLLENFKRALDANNIGIPYPIMDVNLRQVSTSINQP